MDATKLQSYTIDFLRFPLTIMVIFIHMNPEVTNLIDADFSLISERGIYNVIGIIFSHVLPHIAVPTFFFISGYLFFINIDYWSWDLYFKKMRSRIKTLFLPYLFWNLIPIVVTIVLKIGGVILKGKPISGIFSYISELSWHIFYDCSIWNADKINWLGDRLYETGPLDFPLWFLRDLIVVSGLTPLIYYSIRKFGIFVVFFLFFAYLSRIWILTPGFSITAFFYFSLGSFFSMYKINIVSFVKCYRLFFIVPSVILLFVTTIWDGGGTVFGQNIIPFFICTTVFSTFYMVSIFIEKYHILPNKMLVSSCFFIYALHAVPLPQIESVLYFSANIINGISSGICVGQDIICYITSPILTALICLITLSVGRKLIPKTMLLFTGNR